MSKTLKYAVISLDVVLAIIVIYFKLNYYLNNKGIGPGQYFHNTLEATIWILISLLISLSPLIAQGILININTTSSAVSSGILLIGIFCFEGLSMLGSAMTLDDNWMYICTTMLKIQLLYLIPVILNIVLLKNKS